MVGQFQLNYIILEIVKQNVPHVSFQQEVKQTLLSQDSFWDIQAYQQWSAVASELRYEIWKSIIGGFITDDIFWESTAISNDPLELKIQQQWQRPGYSKIKPRVWHVFLKKSPSRSLSHKTMKRQIWYFSDPKGNWIKTLTLAVKIEHSQLCLEKLQHSFKTTVINIVIWN